MENKMMAMRVALRDVSRVAEEMTRGTITNEPVDRKTVDAWAMRLCEIISRDLAIPLRNCDVGTAEEQDARFSDFCLSYYDPCNVDGECWKCSLFKTKTRCPIAWAQMPYEKEKGSTK